MQKPLPKVLIVEDDLTLAFFIKKKLQSLGLDVTVVDKGEIGLKEALSKQYSLMILDIALPDMSGHKVLEALRVKTHELPVIVITDHVDSDNELKSFEAGGNLFHSKPIDFELLTTQVKSILKFFATGQLIKLGDLKVDPERRTFEKAGSLVRLTSKEFDLLLLLISTKGKVVSRDDILGYTFRGAKESEPGSVDTLVSRARRKLGKYKSNSVIETVHKQGFRLNLDYFR